KVREGNRTVERYVKKVQYMPMVAGILKKVRNSGELTSIVANVVYEKDEFNYWVDDIGEHVNHKPNVLAEDRGKLIAVYAIAKTKNGGVYVEVMSRGQIEQVRNVSKSKDSGPWGSWYDEMARKTVIRRLSKRLPMSTDLEAVIRRDDDMYDLNAAARVSVRSGTEAAKALLGVLRDTEGDVIDGDGGEGGEVMTFDADAALKALKEAGSLDDLKAAWDSIIAEVNAVEGASLPLEVEALFKDTKAAFE